MPIIRLNTIVQAPVEKVFDLSRSIDLHQQSMMHTNEKAIAGRLSGLIELNETVTWQARHLFKTRRLTSKITAMNVPHHFRDEMIEGDFKFMIHDHYFTATADGTQMKDEFRFKSPFGIMGRLFNVLFLTNYLEQLLTTRNKIIKATAEQWLQ